MNEIAKEIILLDLYLENRSLQKESIELYREGYRAFVICTDWGTEQIKLTHNGQVVDSCEIK